MSAGGYLQCSRAREAQMQALVCSIFVSRGCSHPRKAKMQACLQYLCMGVPLFQHGADAGAVKQEQLQ